MPFDFMRDQPWKRRLPTLALLRTCLDSDLYRRLPDDHRERCETQTLEFLDQVEILGILEHQVTNQEAVRVAFSCALLYAGRPNWSFPPKVSVRITPTALDDQSLPCSDGNWAGWTCPRSAAVWIDQSAIAFAFKNADSIHTPLHEFAHVLDYGILEPGRTADGVPRDLGLFQRGAWLDILSRVRQRVTEAPREEVVRRYAARNPAESFACVVEAFFEQPRPLQLWDSDLYRMLSDFFKQDPARAG